MILKFWPRWPRKRPLNLSSLGGRPVDFILNGIFKISGLLWSKWAIDCLIWKTFIFQIFNIQPPRLLTNLKNESFPNKTYFWIWLTFLQQVYDFCAEIMMGLPLKGWTKTQHSRNCNHLLYISFFWSSSLWQIVTLVKIHMYTLYWCIISGHTGTF